MFPKIPEALGTLSAAALTALAAENRAACETYLAMAPEDKVKIDRAEFQAAFSARPAIAAALAAAQADEAALAELAAEAAAEAAATEEVAPEAEHVTADEIEVVETASVTSGAGATLAAGGVVVPTTVGSGGTSVAVLDRRGIVGHLTAAAGVTGMSPGAQFESWTALAETLYDYSKTVTQGSGRKFPVAQLRGDYAPDRILNEDDRANLAKFERAALPRFDRNDEITAAFCAPATPYYGLACENSLARPVFGSLPQFAAPRGKVSIAQSPTLADITGQTNPGYGQWTSAMDDDVNAVKNCAVVTCNSFQEYQMYAVWRCITIKNMMMMTYPELVEAFLNRLGAAWSRLAETLLMEAMGTGAVHINAKALGYGATTTVLSTMLEYLALYQETQRWDITGNMRVWMHRYVLTGIKMDLYRRRRMDGQPARVVSDEQVTALFRDAGFDVTWVMDTPSWIAPVSAVASGGIMNTIPTSVQALIAPPGKFALIDRGELSIGVNGNNLYRDNTSNSKNQFTLFFESFEGVVNTTSCPAHILDIPVCWNGIQVDDQLVNCAGQNMPAYQS